MTIAPDVLSRGSRSPEAPALSRRRDIDGLRALAIGLVVVYHVWLDRVSGGVDVFLLISAFLLTDSFLRRARTGRSFPIVGFWRRRFASLLPAVAVTLLGVLLLAVTIYPPSRWHTIWTQTWASLFYVENWTLLASSADYYVRSDQTSPLQHFWSLAIQGQVFVLWPVLFVLIAWLARRRSISVATVAGTVFGAIFMVSFAYSVVATSVDQQAAYFNTFARLWEFALGSLVAVFLPALRLTSRIGSWLTVLGVAAIISCGLVLDVSGGFPGHLALWPTLGAVAVIVGGRFALGAAATRWLSSRPMLALSKISYALYLVHWPILVTWLVVSGRSEAGLISGFGVVAVSLLLATILTRAVDEPVRRFSRARGTSREAVVIAVSTALVVAPLAAWQATETLRANEKSADHPGASAVITGELAAVRDEPPIPSAARLANPWFEPGEGCGDRFSDLPDTCFVLSPEGEPSLRVLVIGNSHAQQWAGALEPLAERDGWEVTMLIAGGCGIGPQDDGLRGPGECQAWRDAAFAALEAVGPDLVVTVGTVTSASSPEERIAPGIEHALDAIRSASNANVLLLRDNPRYGFDMYECAERQGLHSDECVVPVDELLAPENPLRVFDPVEGVQSADLSGYVCPEAACRPVVGNVFVYFDDNHLTTEYTRSMSFALEDALARGFGAM